MPPGEPLLDFSDDAVSAGRRIKGLDSSQRQAQRRQKLLDAALDRFAADGYANTAIEALCQDAGVSTRSYYQLFDGKEALYLALVRQISERLMTRMMEAFADAPADAHEASARLVGAFVHALVDDPRLARVTFGPAGAFSPAFERQRRANRRWAADFVEAVWRQYDATGDRDRRDPHPDLHRMAVALIGGMFDLIADFMFDDDPARANDVDGLITDLRDFYEVVRHGLGA